MNIYEKFGDYLLDLTKLVVGAVILGGIMMEGFKTTDLYTYGSIIAGAFSAIAFVCFKIGQKK